MKLAPGEESSRRLRVVCFANARLPETDYRIGFAKSSDRCEVTIATPAITEGLSQGQWEHINVRAGFGWSTIRGMMRVPGILRRREADAAIFFATQFATLGPVLARSVGVRPVVTITGLGRSFGGGAVLGLLMPWMYVTLFRLNVLLCSAVLFQNSSDMERLSSRLGPRGVRKCHLVGSGIDVSYFDADPRVLGRPPRCLLVARLMPQKGVQDFLAVAAALSDRASFGVIGPGSDEHPASLRSVMEAAASGFIEYLGEQASADVRLALKECAVLVLPSGSEGLPRIALEATLSGVAVAAYDIPGCRAALGPDYPLVKPGDRRGLISTVESFLSNSEYRCAVVNQGRSHVITRLSVSAYVDRLEGFLG